MSRFYRGLTYLHNLFISEQNTFDLKTLRKEIQSIPFTKHQIISVRGKNHLQSKHLKGRSWECFRK